MVFLEVIYGCKSWTICWAPKNWCFWFVVLEKTLESPLDCKEIKQVNPKGNQSWIFIARTGTEAEDPIFWPPDVKNWLIGKDSDAGKDWGQEEKGTTEDEMVGWYQWLDGHGFEQAPRVGDGQGSLVAAVHGVTKSWTQLSDWTELYVLFHSLFRNDLWIDTTVAHHGTVGETEARVRDGHQERRVARLAPPAPGLWNKYMHVEWVSKCFRKPCGAGISRGSLLPEPGVGGCLALADGWVTFPGAATGSTPVTTWVITSPSLAFQPSFSPEESSRFLRHSQ